MVCAVMGAEIVMNNQKMISDEFRKLLETEKREMALKVRLREKGEVRAFYEGYVAAIDNILIRNPT